MCAWKTTAGTRVETKALTPFVKLLSDDSSRKQTASSTSSRRSASVSADSAPILGCNATLAPDGAAIYVWLLMLVQLPFVDATQQFIPAMLL